MCIKLSLYTIHFQEITILIGTIKTPSQRDKMKRNLEPNENGGTLISRFTKKKLLAGLLPKNKARTASQNTIRCMTSAIWRISAELNIPFYPETAVKQANEDANLASIVVISTTNKHVEVKNSTLVFMSSTFMLSIEILISTFFSLLPFTPTSLFLIWFANCQKRKKFKTMLYKCSCINGVVIYH